MPSYVVNCLLCVGVGDSCGNAERGSNRVFRKIGGLLDPVKQWDNLIMHIGSNIIVPSK